MSEQQNKQHNVVAVLSISVFSLSVCKMPALLMETYVELFKREDLFSSMAFCFGHIDLPHSQIVRVKEIILQEYEKPC
jgi:hypothetical protein